VNDCRNAEIRDQLPDLLHDRLSAGARAAVLVHVDSCAECRDELALLRGVHRALVMATPRIDTSRIVSALPKPGASVQLRSSRPSRSRWTDWRVAATITVVALGGMSVALLTRSSDSGQPLAVAPGPMPAPQAPVAGPPATGSASVPAVPTTTRGVGRETTLAQSTPSTPVASAADDAPTEIGMEGRLTGLNERQLRALLDDIQQLKAVPITEPEPVTLKVDTKTSPGSTGDMEIM